MDETVPSAIAEPLPPAPPEEQPRPLTVDEAVVIAIDAQRSGQLDVAHELLKRVLEVLPDHAQGLHYAGVLAHQQGRSAEGIPLIERSLALVPGEADWHSNLGIVQQGDSRFDAAIESYRRAIALNPNHANAHSNLGVLLRATGHSIEAEEAYRTAIRIDPEHIDAYSNLGILLNGLKRTVEASECFCKVILLRPRHKEARKLLALAHCTLGDVDQAVKIFEEWLADEPDDPIARHMLAACTGREVPARASDRFVERSFDTFAESFEAKLAKLSYRAPALVATMVQKGWPEPSKRYDVLDAGCGTGWCGPLLAPYARHLTGVDLSQGMLDRAREKPVYDLLVKGELTEYLRSRPAAFDLIVSADTLVYFGVLEDVAAAAAAALRPGGMLVFTLEHAADADDTPGAHPPDPGFHLQFHGRYTHSQQYVEGVLARAGFRVEIAHAELRMEAGVAVAGLVVRAMKDAESGVPDA